MKRGLSVVSDIDDTIKISEVSSKRELLANQFLRPFEVVPSMASVYRRWQQEHPGAAFHYVSASPWQLYGPLSKFALAERFPAGTFQMKLFRPKDSTFFDLFMDQVQFKLGQIEPLLRSYPQRRFVLVGDSGEQDPEIYGELARKYPEQVVGIFIRNVSGEDARGQRFQNAMKDVPGDLWRVFDDAESLGDVSFPLAETDK